jgi:hypothetical protein
MMSRPITQVGNKWARLFAAGDDGAACAYENQPVCEWMDCKHVGNVPIPNCTPPSAGLRKSFADATVQDIAIKGQNAGVRFSNGEAVQFIRWGDIQVPVHGPSPDWVVARIGGKGPPVFR